jgi:Protein of unknown function (DUF4199)
MVNVIKNIGFRNGLILGVVLIALRCYIYFIDPKLLVNVWLGFATILVFVFFGILSIVQSKRKMDGFITFKDTFSTYFFTILTGHFFSCLSVILITNLFLTVEVQESIKTLLTNFNISILKQNNSSLKDINTAIALSKNYNPSDILEIISGSIKYLLRDCLIGIFVSLIFRNKTAI